MKKDKIPETAPELASKNAVVFADPDGAAAVFAMGVHAILEYEPDCRTSESGGAEGMMERFIAEFSSHHEKEAPVS